MKRIVKALLTCALILTLALSAVFPAFADSEKGLTETLIVPQIRIVTEEGNGNDIKKADGYVDARISIVDVDGSTVADDEIKFKVRGNSTSYLYKKPFTFKFEKKKDLFSMGSAKKWALLANAYDPTLMRNYLAIDIAWELGLPYTSEQRIVELWVDDVFKGCYTLIEPVQEGKSRVNIDIESNDGKKDFLIEEEATRFEEGVTYFRSNGIRFIASEPEEPDEEQLAYIQRTVDDIISTIRTGSREEIERKIDIGSFAKYYLLNEFVKTVDFDYSSVFYFYKDGKLYAGPAWDYDLALGNESPDTSENYARANDTAGLYANDKNIYRFLCAHKWFYEEVQKVYRAHSAYLDNIADDNGWIDFMLNEYGEVFDRNYTDAQWNIRIYWIGIHRRPLPTYGENIDYLRTWISERNDWLKDYFSYYFGAYKLGDADGDDKISITDVTFIQRRLADLTDDPDGRIKTCGDVTQDGLDISDATMIQRCLADIENPYHIGSDQ